MQISLAKILHMLVHTTLCDYTPETDWKQGKRWTTFHKQVYPEKKEKEDNLTGQLTVLFLDPASRSIDRDILI